MMSPVDRKLRCIVSVHDVMPETLENVGRILDRLDIQNVRPVTLLVVPGRKWTPAQIDRLREFERAGFHLAGHGWVHQVSDRRTLYHRLHGILLSRMVAEHLALDRSGIRRLMVQCHQWFGTHGLCPPALYVPPAWEMGDIPFSALIDLPFKRYETTGGVYVAQNRRFYPLPLVGYEADTAFRSVFLRGMNRMNMSLALWQNRPLRVSIHPYDLDFPLATLLFKTLSTAGRFFDYRVEHWVA